MSTETPARQGLLVDFGGVLMAGIRESFLEFCEEEGIDPKHLGRCLRDAWGENMETHPLHLFEIGKLEEDEFCRLFAAELSKGGTRSVDPVGCPDG